GPANEAAAEFELLLRLRPRDPEALLGLVRCRRQQNRLEEAQQLLNELTSLRPDDGPVLLERGRLALAGGNPKGAEAWLRKAVERSPCDRETRYALYQCLQQQGKDTEAWESMAVFKRLDADLKRIDVLTNQMQKTP